MLLGHHRHPPAQVSGHPESLERGTNWSIETQVAACYDPSKKPLPAFLKNGNTVFKKNSVFSTGLKFDR